jgi:hypothetical protein
MDSVCAVCGCTEVEAIADARSLDLDQELQSGVYTCCQIAEWAVEQLLAWSEAAQEDGEPVHDMTKPHGFEATKFVVVPIRLRRPPVPRFADPD